MELDSIRSAVVRNVGGMLANAGVTGTVLGVSVAEVGSTLLRVGQFLIVVVSLVVGFLQWRKLRLEIKKLENEK